MKLNVQLKFAGNAEEAFLFYKNIFNTDLSPIYRYKDMAAMGMDNIPKSVENYVANIMISIGESKIIGFDVSEEGFNRSKNQDTLIHITPDSKEDAKRIFDALSENGKVVNPINQTPFGYYGSLIDKYGVGWEVLIENL
ncbi:VOC family protein [Streptococcus sp. CSL10205-OR2]|uniref:VOC family protein n=1 Tax=Streptococcus sp. CSL10205-OR2 TaxID=2980558 RepID=UPI0021DA42DB|nr:VOC family protein [Streptococcus sp. CSL10205-OR2]MCU9533244.1 VOC family protein [Streptococcus sp. CSL10205-OR2]